MNNLSQFEIDSTKISPPIGEEGLLVKLNYIEQSLAEVQPVLSVDRFVFHNNGVSALLKAREKYGPYQQIPFKFSIDNINRFDGYLTDLNFLLDVDQIEAKAVSLESVDGLSELLSAITASSVANNFTYENLDFIVQKVDINPELLQLGLSILFYSYVLYSQIRETVRIVSKTFVEGPLNAAGLSFGTIAVAVIQLAAQAIFIIITIIQLIKYAKQAKELLLPRKRTTKVISLRNIVETYLNKAGYQLQTNIADMSETYHWASGDVNNKDYFPRTSDRCGSATGAISLVLEKYNAKAMVIDRTVYVYQEQDDFFFENSSYVLPSFIEGNYRENLDDMVGTREIIYSVDFDDQWTVQEGNFIGTEYRISANIIDSTKSTIKGIEQSNYGVALCNRKDSLNNVESTWNQFINFVNAVSSLFGGPNQILSPVNTIGTAKISSENLGVAKLVKVKNRKIPPNHRQTLSAKSDEENYHWTKSHVRNPRAKKKIFEDIRIAYDSTSLAKTLKNGYIRDMKGVRGKFEEIEWEYQKTNAKVTFWLEDVDRDTKLIEEFYEPTR